MISNSIKIQSSEESIAEDMVFQNRGEGQSRIELLDFSILKLSDEQSNDDYDNSDQVLNGWIKHVKDSFYGVPEVESIYLARVEETTHVWIMIPKRNFALLQRLVELELRVLDMLCTKRNSILRLEFHITYRNGRDEKRLVPLQAITIPR